MERGVNQGMSGQRSLPRPTLTRVRSRVVSVALALLCGALAFAIPYPLSFPHSSGLILFSLVCGLLALQSLLKEKKMRDAFSQRALSYGEKPIDLTALGNLALPLKWTAICLLLTLFQSYSEIAVRKDLRRSFPFLASLIGSGSLEIATFVGSPEDGRTERLNSATPGSLFEGSAALAPIGKKTIAWPTAPNQPQQIAVWNPDQGWNSLPTTGTLPEFRHNPDFVPLGKYAFLWGGYRHRDVSAGQQHTPLTNGYALDLSTRSWVRLPSIKQEGLLRSKLIGGKNEISLVTLSYEGTEKLSPILRTYQLTPNLESWIPKHQANLKDFNAVEIYGGDGIVILSGVLGAQGASIFQSLDSVAKTVLDAFDLRTFEDQIKGKANQVSRFLIFDLAKGLSSTDGTLLPLEAPTLLNGATVMGSYPDIVALRDENQGFVLCRFKPLECHAPISADGRPLLADGNHQSEVRLVGDNATFWLKKAATGYQYDFKSRHLKETSYDQIPQGARPYAILPTGQMLYGLSNFETSGWELGLSKSLAAIACPLSPVPDHLSACPRPQKGR